MYRSFQFGVQHRVLNASSVLKGRFDGCVGIEGRLSDHYVPDGFERDREQEFERAENFLHVYSSKESGKGYTVRCSIIQPGQQSSFDNEHTTYENVKVGDADATLGTSASENGDTVYILSWEQGGVSNTIMGNISRDEIMKIAENVF